MKSDREQMRRRTNYLDFVPERITHVWEAFSPASGLHVQGNYVFKTWHRKHSHLFGISNRIFRFALVEIEMLFWNQNDWKATANYLIWRRMRSERSVRLAVWWMTDRHTLYSMRLRETFTETNQYRVSSSSWISENGSRVAIWRVLLNKKEQNKKCLVVIQRWIAISKWESVLWIRWRPLLWLW